MSLAMRLLDKKPKPEDLRPGDMWYANVTWYRTDDECPYWDNCDHRHLLVVLPNNQIHDLHARASNCTMPDERTHRCWIVHGTPPVITVDKQGNTCKAGAGSIMRGGWHGFIRGGEFVKS